MTTFGLRWRQGVRRSFGALSAIRIHEPIRPDL
jgi:hypothetical protein